MTFEDTVRERKINTCLQIKAAERLMMMSSLLEEATPAASEEDDKSSFEQTH